MLDTGGTKVLVGVVTGERSEAAVAYAAAQARRRGCGVHVVTVLHPVFLGPSKVTELVLDRGELHRAGTDVLQRAAAGLEHRLRDVDLPVSTEILHGPVVPSLVETSRQAALVVLQRQHPDPLPRIATRSVTRGVAAHAAAPVAVVPADWRPPDPDDPVVIGVEDVEDPAASAAVVRAGLELARLDGAPARLVHAWWFSDAYDDLVFAGDAGVRETADRRARLAAATAGLRAEYPDVEVQLVVRHSRPADLLVRFAATASAVVVGRHHPSYPLGSHLGPITGAVLGEAVCPVVVVDPQPAPGR